MLSPKDKIKNVRIPFELSEDLAYLCGVIAGDGHINIRLEKHDWLIKCVGNPKDEISFYNEVIGPLFLKLFGYQPIMRLQDCGETYGFCTWSRTIVEYLVNVGLPFGKKYDKLRIPPEFLSYEHLTAAFIRGVADTDFHLGLKRGSKKRPIYPTIVGCSKSHLFIIEIGNWLIQKGIKPRIHRRKQLDSRFKSGYAETSIIEMAGHENFRKWMSLIGFAHPKNLNKVEKYKNSGGKI